MNSAWTVWRRHQLLDALEREAGYAQGAVLDLEMAQAPAWET